MAAFFLSFIIPIICRTFVDFFNIYKDMTLDLTPIVIATIKAEIKAFLANPKNDIADVEIAFREIETAGIRAIHDEALLAHPYNHIAITVQCTDARFSKIHEIVNKK